jgi:hypothetical protein
VGGERSSASRLRRDDRPSWGEVLAVVTPVIAIMVAAATWLGGFADTVVIVLANVAFWAWAWRYRRWRR